MDKTKKVMIYTGIALLLVLIVWGLFLYISYLNVTIVEGEGYGFKIGMTKEQVFETAQREYKKKKIFTYYPSEDNASIGSFSELRFSVDDLDKLKPLDFWVFYYKGNSFDSIKLTFNTNSLVEIHRHRKYLVIPNQTGPELV